MQIIAGGFHFLQNCMNKGDCDSLKSELHKGAFANRSS